MDCIFCKIINKEISSNIVYENEFVTAFEDLNPVAKVHTLVVPKKHIESLNELKNEDMNYILEVFKAIKEIAKIKEIDETGYRVVNNCGEEAGQTVRHIHFHLIGGEKLGQMA